jgi:sugar phosphate permease
MAIIFISYVVCMADRSNIGAVLPWVKKEFTINNLQSGMISSFFFLGYAVSQIPAGLFIGKKGTRGIVSIAILGFSIVTFLMGHVVTATIHLRKKPLPATVKEPLLAGLTSLSVIRR